MTHVAADVRIDSGQVEIDGERFPWYLADEEITVYAGRASASVVYLPLIAATVTVTDHLSIAHTNGSTP